MVRFPVFSVHAMAVPQKKRVKKGVIGGIDFTKAYVCTMCGCQREPILVRRGNGYIEITLWLFFIFPGLMYSLWRLVRKHEVCPKCMQPGMIRTGSSQGFQLKRLMKELSKPPAKLEEDLGN